MTFTPDGNQIASGDAEGRLKVWQTATGQLLFDRQAHKGEVRSVAYDPAGDQLASAGADWSVKIWDATLSQEIQTLKGHHCWCHGVAFSPEQGFPVIVDEEPASRGTGRRLASVSGDGDARIWDADGNELHTISAHGNVVRGVAIGRGWHSAGHGQYGRDPQALGCRHGPGSPHPQRPWERSELRDVQPGWAIS